MNPRGRRRWKSPLLAAVVAGDSMAPTLRHGDFVLIARGRRVRSGRLVAVRDPREPGRIMVKRAVERRGAGWWVLGDNPAASTDSRVFGPVPDALVVGGVLVRYWRAPR